MSTNSSKVFIMGQNLGSTKSTKCRISHISVNMKMNLFQNLVENVITLELDLLHHVIFSW